VNVEKPATTEATTESCDSGSLWADVQHARAPTVFDVGECALVVEFGQDINPLTNDRVVALDQALTRAELPGVLEVVPTYRSLMIHYDPLIISRSELAAHARRLMSVRSEAYKPRRWSFPVCYDEQFGIDLASAAWSLELPASKIVTLHSSATYRIYMHGFAPGLPALGGLPEALRLPRFMTPRKSVPAGSVIIVLNQASIASVDMPCAWHVIGRTPERLFVLGRDPTVLTATGDEITFDPIDMHTFELLDQRAEAGETVARVVG